MMCLNWCSEFCFLSVAIASNNTRFKWIRCNFKFLNIDNIGNKCWSFGLSQSLMGLCLGGRGIGHTTGMIKFNMTHREYICWFLTHFSFMKELLIGVSKICLTGGDNDFELVSKEIIWLGLLLWKFRGRISLRLNLEED